MEAQLKVEKLMNKNLNAPAEMEIKEKIYKLHLIKNTYCDYKCTFPGCTAKIKYIMETEAIESRGGHIIPQIPKEIAFIWQ